MNLKNNLLILLSILFAIPVIGQQTLGGAGGDESDLYAQTKQVNQFFRRFNNEEDHYGKRYYPGDEQYRSKEFRDTYLEILFDQESAFIQRSLKDEFIDHVMNTDGGLYLDFHGKNWFAELATTFEYYGNNENPILFLQLEQENLGYKWVITNVYFDMFLAKFNKGNPEKVKKKFLHPLSHELDFMNLYKAFRDPVYVEYFTNQGFKPDYKTLLFYEVKLGNMSFKDSGNLKFHFFQIEGWYFEVSYFNRPGPNSGWLISKLYKISDKEREDLLKFYLP